MCHHRLFRALPASCLALLLLALLVLPLSPVLAQASPATWTKGHKKVLIIPLRFSDFGGPSDAPHSSGYLSGWGAVADGTMTAAISEFYERQSYGQTTMAFTLLPEINLGVSYTTYNATLPGTGGSKFTYWWETGSFADDVLAKTKQVGLGTADPALYDADNYDLYIIATGFYPGATTGSEASAYGKGINARNFKVLAHELCHNFSLGHAFGLSRSTMHLPLTNSKFLLGAYGEVYDLMGYQDTVTIPLLPDQFVSTAWMNKLGWLAPDYVNSPVSSGLYRIHAFDQAPPQAGQKFALRIPRGDNLTYWLDYRAEHQEASNPWLKNGLNVRFGPEPYVATSGHTQYLDCTPGSRGPAGQQLSTMYDAPLAIGRTFADPEINLFVTPVKKGGTTPESLDVMVNLGPFPGNAAPSASIAPATVTLAAGVSQLFTVSASDPNGDTLAYHWEFDDNTAPGGTAYGDYSVDSRSATTASHTWTTNGTWLVRCTVTDMKGKKTIAGATVTVTGGSTAPKTISGVIKDESGNPLAGAIVNNFKTNNPGFMAYGDANFIGSSETAADGKFIIPVTNNATYYLTVMYQGYSFTCNYAGGVVSYSGSSIANVNFTRVRANRVISGSIVMGGHSFNPAVDGAITISDGTQSVQATAAGWQLTVADGTTVTLTATSANPACQLKHYFPNPLTVTDDYGALHFFADIPDTAPRIGFTSAGGASDDSVGTVQVPVVMTLPTGSSTWPALQTANYFVDPSSTAEYGVDYIMPGGRLNFYANQVPATRYLPLKILPTGEGKVKTVVIRLEIGNALSNLAAQSTYTYTITNLGPAPTASVASVSVPESAAQAQVMVTLNHASFGDLSVDYLTADGSATGGADYAGTSGTLTIPAGETSGLISIPLMDDALLEGLETFTVTLSNPVNAVLGTSEATVTLTDNELPVVTVTANDAYAGEPENHGSFLVARSGPTTSALSVTVAIGGSATPGADYTALAAGATKVITLAAGRASVGIQVAVLADGLIEASETITLTVQPSANYAVGEPANAVVMIASELPQVTVIANDANAAEPSNNGSFLVARTGPTTSALSVTVTIGGTATPGVDYTALTSTGTKVITLGVGRASIGVQVAVLADAAQEAAETVTMSVQPSASYDAAVPAMATVTIASELPKVTVTASDAAAGEPSNNGNFLVARTGDTSAALAVTVLIGGTATPGVDYTAISATSTKVITLAAGRASVGIQVAVLGDGVEEPTETVTMAVQPSASYDLGVPTLATVTIANDRNVVSLAVADGAAGEPNNHGSFLLTRVGNLAASLTVGAVVSGSATPGSDFSSIASSLTFPAGQGSLTVPVTVLNDALPEPAETVILTLQSGASYDLTGAAQGTVTIASDEVLVSLTSNDNMAAEPANHGSFLVSRTGSTASALSVTVTIGGTATPGTDYKAISNTSTKVVTLAAGKASVGVKVEVLDDALVEGPETVSMTLQAIGCEISGPATTTVYLTSDDPAAAASANAVTAGISSVTPSVTALGNELRILGAGLAAKRVTARLVGLSESGKRGKRYPLRVLAVSEHEVRVRVQAGVVGDYRLVLRLAGGPTYESPVLVTLAAPAPAGLSPATLSGGGELVITGSHFGTRKGSVSLGDRRVRVRSWSDIEITIQVPKTMAPGSYPVRVRSLLGEGLADEPLLIE